ncbi:hypothetical protein CPB97_010460 [Podila verticillata]|nr:hypothetical protein CPB97_010460 [Podila verticillata]
MRTQKYKSTATTSSQTKSTMRHFPWLLAVVILVGIAVAAPLQFVLRAPQPHSLNLEQGDDTMSVLRQMAQSLNRGRPGAWERLMNAPTITGSHSVNAIHPSEVRNVVQSWGVDGETLEKTCRDIQLVVETAMSDGVFLAQGFVYNLPRCPIDVPHPACLSNLVVVTRILEATDNEVVKFELGHFYLISTTETHQQPWNYHTCHRCRIWGHCCHDETRYRDLNAPELIDVQAVLSTFQSEWALDQLHPLAFFHHEEISVLSDIRPDASGFESLLRQIIGNSDENKDAQRIQTDEMLRAIQNFTRTALQSLKIKQMTVPTHRIVRLLEILLGPCFKRANVQEAVPEWWERARGDSLGSPVSVECEFVDQRREPIDPPMSDCFIGTNVTSQTFYSWGLIQEHDNGSLNVLFLENDLTIGYTECTITDEPSDSEFALNLLLSLSPPADVSSGAIVRTASIQADGSFHDVKFLAQWSRYSSFVNKVALDLLRLAACASFLGMPTPQYSAWDEPVSTMVADPSFAALMSSIQLFAKTWQEVVKAFGSSTTQTVQRRVCLGFDSLDYKVDTLLMKGVREEAVPKVVDILARRAVLPDREDLKQALELVVYSDDFTWLSQLMQYTNPAGEASFVFLGKYGNDTDHRAKMVFSQVHSTFDLAKDMLIVRQQSSKLGGLIKEDKTYIEYIPHTLTLNDTLVLQMFWQMMSYHQVVMALGEQPPAYPDLSFLCDRTIP